MNRETHETTGIPVGKTVDLQGFRFEVAEVRQKHAELDPVVLEIDVGKDGTLVGRGIEPDVALGTSAFRLGALGLDLAP
jgi:hypothetical protein